MQPLKVIHNAKLAYLVSLSNMYREMGYRTVLKGFESILEIFPKNSTKEEIENATRLLIGIE